VALGADAGLPPLPSERATIIARLGGKVEPSVGETVSFSFSPEDLRLFDGSSGDAVPVHGRSATRSASDPAAGTTAT
jgi:hypothetical protein